MRSKEPLMVYLKAMLVLLAVGSLIATLNSSEVVCGQNGTSYRNKIYWVRDIIYNAHDCT